MSSATQFRSTPKRLAGPFSWIRPGTTRGRQRIVGILLLGLLLVVFFGLLDTPTLDTAREEVAIASSVDLARSGVPADQVSNCFQGFCFEDDVSVIERGWRFSITYLRLMGWAIALAVIAAATVDAFLFRTDNGPAFGSAAGHTMLRLDQAERLRPGAIATGRSGIGALIGVGSLNAAAVVVVLLLFSPFVAGIRIVLGLLAVALSTRFSGARVVGGAGLTEAPEGWSVVVKHGLRDAATAAWRFAYRLVPLFVVAALIGGFGGQLLTIDGVEAVVGDHLGGIVIASVVGIGIGVPLLAEIPLVAAALLLGMGVVPAGVLLFSTAAIGPSGLRSSAAALTSRRIGIGAVAIAVAVVGTAGGSVALGASNFVESATVPTIAFDGESCTYRGPDRLGPQVHEFTVRNDTTETDTGLTMAVVVGRLPANVSTDHFAAIVAADPTAALPEWFTVAGTAEFIFPGTEQTIEITLHAPGTYAAVCLNGGGFYVIYEFSMPQPMGWFDEFRSTFDGYVAETTFQVAG